MEKKAPARVLIDSGSDTVLVEPESGRMFYLNETGAFVYQLLEKNTPDEEIVRLLCKEFDTQEAEAAADLGFFRKTLQAFLGRAS
ncbi:MAG: PqqD family protein [Deltaproteobacteria bacterium]|nr:PqqD family protein [Deltaproteobacteria bacterium]